MTIECIEGNRIRDAWAPCWEVSLPPAGADQGGGGPGGQDPPPPLLGDPQTS